MLHHQLAALVGDFGYANVRKTLGDLRRDSVRATKLPRPKTKETAADSPARKKPDAVAVVRSLNIADSERREFLLSLAQKYEAKQFMPNVTHVRSFLMHDHDDPSRIKSRQQVTVKVFKKLAEMSAAELRETKECGFYDPPKRLETYARAIENFGRSVRNPRHKTPEH